jgi:hypothetical protein
MSEPSTPLPIAEIEHRLPGRLRLRLASRRGDAAFLASIAERLARLPGVRSLRANPRTGSILIEHDGAAEALGELAKEQGVLQIAPPAPPVPRSSGGAGHRTVRVPPLSVVAAGLAGLGLYQAARGRLVGSGTGTLWKAFGAYAYLNRPRLAAALAGFGLYRLARGPALGSAVSLFYYAISAHHMARQRNDGG